MRKRILIISLLFVTIATMSFVGCKNGQNEPGNSTTEPTADNPYPYLRVDDLMPLQMISISQAEENLAKMGYKGGWQTYSEYYEGKAYQTEGYLYFSEDKKDSIFLFPNSDGLIDIIKYNASRGVIPSEAKAWLTHIPEKVTIPERIAQVIGKNEIAFFSMGDADRKIGCETYSEYLEAIKNLTSGMHIYADWGTIISNPPSGYYPVIMMQYGYINNIDWASLYIGFDYHEQKDDKPLEPSDPPTD